MTHEGSLTKYRQGCRCDGCRAENARAQRDYQARKRGALRRTGPLSGELQSQRSNAGGSEFCERSFAAGEQNELPRPMNPKSSTSDGGES